MASNQQIIETEKLENFILQNEWLMKPYEISWTAEIVKDDLFGKKYFDTVDFLKRAKAKNRRTHAKQCQFYFKIFEWLGLEYS